MVLVNVISPLIWEFIMNGGQITKNYFYGGLSMASVVSIYDGSFTMNGGEIFNNVGSDPAALPV